MIRAYQSSQVFADLAPATQKLYNRALRAAEQEDALGAYPVSVVRPAKVQLFLDALAATPGAASIARTALSAVQKWALVRDLDGDEPNENGSMPHGSGRTEAEAVVDLIENYTLDVQCERDVRHCGHCGKSWWTEGREDVPGDCPEFGCPLRDSEWDLPNDCTCSVRMTSVHSASIDPPEPYIHRDEWCPVHGRDPDEAYEAARDDARTFGRERAIYKEDF